MYRSQNNPMSACTQLPFEAHLVKTTAIYPKAQFVPNSKMQISLLTCGAIYPSRSVCELQSFGDISHRVFFTIKWSKTTLWCSKCQKHLNLNNSTEMSVSRNQDLVAQDYLQSLLWRVAHRVHRSSRLTSGLASANLDGDKMIKSFSNILLDGLDQVMTVKLVILALKNVSNVLQTYFTM